MIEQVEQFYDADVHVEWERLDRHRVEFAVTMHALVEFLPAIPAAILDIGGGPGRYAISLAQRGYQVTLADLSRASLQRANERASSVGVRLAGVHHANAVDLSRFSDASFDAVLMLGPLYHLVQEEDRHQAIQEAKRVLKPEGVLFAAFLTHFSALRVCAERFPEWLAENADYADRILETGIHDGEWGFTTAYHIHPAAVAPLMEMNGFTTVQIVNCEGIVGHAEERINALSGSAWEWWSNFNYRLGKDPALHGSATHLLYVGQKI